MRETMKIEGGEVLYGRPVDERDEPLEQVDVDDLEDEVLIKNVAVRIALEAEALVGHLNRGSGYTSRRRALASCRDVARRAGQLADTLSEGGRAADNGK